MSSVLAWSDLEARLAAAQIALNGIVLPISWPNRNFALPPSPPGTPAGVKLPWLLVEMTGGTSLPIELGGSVWQGDGQSIVHVLVQTGTGVADAMALVDQVTAMFRSPPLEPVIYHAIHADPGGPGSDDGLYWRTSISADWHIRTTVTFRSE